REGGQSEFPLSFAQERLWFLDQLAPGGTAYTLAAGLHLRGDLRIAALTRALGEIVCRHEVLRTVFATRCGQPVQRILAPHLPTPPAVALAALPAPLSVALRLAREEVRRPFSLGGERGLLLRATLFRLAPREHLLLVGMHHIVSDAWSIAIFA